VISFTDGTVYQGGFWASNEYYPTSEENESGMGTGAVLAAGEKLHFPFYAKSDNMIAVPSMFSSNANMSVKISLILVMSMRIIPIPMILEEKP
jgi:hypothetical protein